ncbi:hypothetical protein F5X96DRAFT_553339 [Biscogniauxia mediterranea]|nr:hypothetical protein F5X96DRAFT_553339 [Biscogniauxia mediterranea]
MRLLYEHDGERIGIETAVQKNPLAVRGLLIQAWLLCEKALPDSVDVLEAERALRDAISQFKGGDHVPRYLLKGKVELGLSANKNDLLQLSLRIGGLVALIAVFYGTAYNATGGRKVLRCLDRISDDSKVDLLKRVHLHPISTAMRALLIHILRQHGTEMVGMACLLYCLGTKELPRWVLTACEGPSRTWGENGEISEVTPDHITPMLRDQHHEGILSKLEGIGLVRLSRDLIRIDTQWAGLLDMRDEALYWKFQSILILSHVFPKHRAIDADMHQKCERLLPNLEHAFIYLGDPQVMTHLIKSPGFYSVMETCLASSYFGDQHWKGMTLAWAKSLLQESRDTSDNRTLWSSRLDVRERQVKRLYSASHTPHIQLSAFPCFDQRSNGFSAELAILNMHELIRQGEFDAAEEELSRFKPCFGRSMSTFEEYQLIKVRRAYGVLRRFQGRFDEAYAILGSLPHEDSLTISHFAAILSARGEDDRAILKLESWLHHATGSHKAKARVQHMLAQVTLVRAMRAVLGGQPPDAPSLHTIRDMYQDLRGSRDLYWRDHICTWIGIAICDHLGGGIEQGIQAWQEVRSLSRQQNLPIGYSDAIVAYSLSELERRRGEHAESEIHAIRARNLILSPGHNFILGMDLWVAVLEDLIRKQAQPPTSAGLT